MTDEIPFLDITAPGFSTRSDAVLEARAQSWCARTPFGFAVLRHRQAGLLLRDRRLRQGSYFWPRAVGLEGGFTDFWERSVIGREGPEHKLQRRVVMAALSEDFVLSLVPEYRQIAQALVRALPKDAPFEFMADFSEPFAGQVIARILGLAPSEAEALGRDAMSLGLAMGIDAKAHAQEINAAYARLAEMADRLIEDASEAGFAARLLAAAQELGVRDPQVLNDLIVISIFGGVDTTRSQLGLGMGLFSARPDQWAALRRDPSMVPQAIEEMIRFRRTTTWSTREALEEITLDGVTMAPGQTVHIFVHATATDGMERPEFDVTARRTIHFGFGGGAHHCLGQFVARTDMAAALEVLVEAWAEVRLGGEPRYLPDSGNTCPSSMPLAPVWALR